MTMARPEFPTDVTRDEFEKVRETLEAARRKTRPRKHDLYDVYCAVLYFLDSGGAWRSLPPEFPPWRTVHEYFTQWTMQRTDGPTLLEQTLETVARPAAAARVRTLLGPRADAASSEPH
jgi:transposase